MSYFVLISWWINCVSVIHICYLSNSVPYQVFREARRSSPSIVYLPNMDLWWETASEPLKSVFKAAVSSLPPSKPLLILGTCEQVSEEACVMLSDVFDPAQGEVCPVGPPTADERKGYFEDVILIGPALPPIDPPKPPEGNYQNYMKVSSLGVLVQYQHMTSQLCS